MKQQELEERKAYQALIAERREKSPLLTDCLKAFLVGGTICLIGQGVSTLGEYALLLEGETLAAFTSVCMVFLGALLTGLGVYDRIYSFGGMGAAVPITGFANSMVSPALEFKSEGFVTGLGAKMFTVAGPVLGFGVAASVAYGLLLFGISLLRGGAL